MVYKDDEDLRLRFDILRRKKKVTYEDIAQKIGKKQQAVSRILKADANSSLKFESLAGALRAMDYELHIDFVKIGEGDKSQDKKIEALMEAAKIIYRLNNDSDEDS